MLAMAPDQINVWNVLTLLETKFSFVDCLTDPNGCDSTATCPIRPIWGKAFQGMTKLFKETSLKDVLTASEDQEKREALGSHQT